jgi:DNA-binding response OmpR family regulator
VVVKILGLEIGAGRFITKQFSVRERLPREVVYFAAAPQNEDEGICMSAA